jgi:hypothetical protein
MILGQSDNIEEIYHERPDVMMMFTENCVTETNFSAAAFRFRFSGV